MICNDVMKIDKKPQHNRLFFGDYDGYAREDYIQYPQLVKLAEASEANTWFKNEIDYVKDIVGWNVLSNQARIMFRKNIAYQNLMDSAVSNIYFLLSKVASNAELQYLYGRIGIEEAIHARTYSNGLNVVFGADAEEILDSVYVDDNLKNRIVTETENAQNFIELCIHQKRSDDEAKMSILKLLGSIYLLEGIKFPFSFFVTWNMNKQYDNSIQGFSRALKLIGWDELTVHTTTGSTVLNLLRNNKEEGFSHLFEEFDGYMQGLRVDILNELFAWNEYLLEDGEIPGYTKEIGEHLIRYWDDYRSKIIKLPTLHNEKKSDIIDWFNKYRNLNGTTTALQEADATNYQKGKLVDDLYKFDLEPKVLKELLAVEDVIREKVSENDRLTELLIQLDEEMNLKNKDQLEKERDKILDTIQENTKQLTDAKARKRELIK